MGALCFVYTLHHLLRHRPACVYAHLCVYTGGAASLQNCLELGLELLGGVPPYGSRELLLLSASLSSVDPGRVEDSIAAVKEARIRCVCNCHDMSRSGARCCSDADAPMMRCVSITPTQRHTLFACGCTQCECCRCGR